MWPARFRTPPCRSVAWELGGGVAIGRSGSGRRLWETGSLLQRSITGVCGPSTAIGHIPPRERRASRRLHSGDLVLSRGSPYQVCSVSVGVIRWTGTPCQMVPRLQVVRIARFIVGWVQQGCTPAFCFVPGCTPRPYPSQIQNLITKVASPFFFIKTFLHNRIIHRSLDGKSNPICC